MIEAQTQNSGETTQKTETPTTITSRCEHLKGQTIPLNWSSIFID